MFGSGLAAGADQEAAPEVRAVERCRPTGQARWGGDRNRRRRLSGWRRKRLAGSAFRPLSVQYHRTLTSRSCLGRTVCRILAATQSDCRRAPTRSENRWRCNVPVSPQPNPRGPSPRSAPALGKPQAMDPTANHRPARGSDHGRQRPLGPRARAPAHGGTPPRGRRRATRRRSGARARHSDADALTPSRPTTGDGRPPRCRR